jgi:uncharacterized protein (TIGR03067 family)
MLEFAMNEIKLAHPSLDQLVAFGQGRLGEAELSALSDHLSGCAECLQKVEASGDDTLISMLRSASTEHDQEGMPDPRKVPTLAPAVEPAAVADLPAELAQHSRYRVQELLGVGGMGAVYKAEHLLMERPVALKVINRELTKNPDTVERFRREVKAAARLTHPNIVHAYDAEQAGDLHFLVMEYIDGNSLARIVAEQGPLPVKQACEYIRQAALGLQYAHEQGMVHRDIKPHNLMLSLVSGGVASGEKRHPGRATTHHSPLTTHQIKILDFGLARFALETASSGGLVTAAPSADAADNAVPQSITQVGTVMGTPDYIAPEQARDAHTADIRADIYSLGCTLYHLLAGQPPYPEGTAVDKIMAHMERPPKPLTELRRDMPPALARVVERMLAKDPAKRYQTPAEIAAALQPFVARPSVRPRRVIRRWLAAACAFVITACLVAGVIIYVQTDKGEFCINTLHPDVTVKVNQKGVKIRDEKSGREYLLRVGRHEVRPGQYQIVATELPDGIEIETGGNLTVKRHGEVIVNAKLRAKSEESLGKTDLERIQGTWREVHREAQGIPAVADEILKKNPPTATVSGNNISSTDDPKDPAAPFKFSGRFHLDPTKQPKAIDFFYFGEDAKPMLGIYRLEGDTLTLCWNTEPSKPEDRPTEFSTKGKKWTLAVWQRVPGAEKDVQAVASSTKDKARLISSFGVGFKPITRDGITEDDGAWKIDATRERFVPLYEVKPPVEECVIYVRAKMKSSNLHGRAYLEMWSRFPLGGEYFSKGLTSAVLGTTDWKSVEIPFILQKNERPDLFKLGIEIEPNATVDRREFSETVWIKDIEIWQAPLPAEMKRPSNLKRAATRDDGRMFEFSPAQVASTEEGLTADQKGLRIEAGEKRTVCLQKGSIMQRPLPAGGTLLTFRAQMKASNLQGQAYLEMLCEFADGPKKGEYFSRGLATPLTGASDWASYETSFALPNDQWPNRFKLNVVIEGKGTVWIKDTELLRGPLPK